MPAAVPLTNAPLIRENENAFGERLDAERLNAEAMRLAESGQLEAAVNVIDQALRLNPRLWTTHNNLGIALARLGRFEPAAASFHRAIALCPTGAQAHNNLANVLANQRRYEEAIERFHCALRLDPDYPDARLNLGKALRAARRFREAEEQFRLVLRSGQSLAQAHCQLGLTLAAQQKWDDAVGNFRCALELDPDNAEAYCQLAGTLKELRRFAEAAACCRRALALRPAEKGAEKGVRNLLCEAPSGPFRQKVPDTFFEALSILGICLGQLGDAEAASGCFSRALQLDPASCAVLSNWGILLAAAGRLDEAVAKYRTALDIDPGSAEIHNNLGSALASQARYAEALGCYERAIELKADYADAHRNRSLLRLLQGDFEQGWPEFEWRWKCRDFKRRDFGRPAWDGSALDGRTILLHAEQGLGDTLQFIRFAPLVRQRGGRVLVRVPERLVPLLSRCRGIDLLLTDADDLPAFDCHLPLLSLPHVFGTTLENLPAAMPYLFADEKLVEYWGRVLGGVRHQALGTTRLTSDPRWMA